MCVCWCLGSKERLYWVLESFLKDFFSRDYTKMEKQSEQGNFSDYFWKKACFFFFLKQFAVSIIIRADLYYYERISFNFVRLPYDCYELMVGIKSQMFESELHFNSCRVLFLFLFAACLMDKQFDKLCFLCHPRVVYCKYEVETTCFWLSYFEFSLTYKTIK